MRGGFLTKSLATAAAATLAALGATTEPLPDRAQSTPDPVKDRPEQTGKKPKRKAKKPRVGRKPAPVVVPDPPTRQIRRQNERRAGKMPVGESQENWHRLMGLQVTRGMQAASRR